MKQCVGCGYPNPDKKDICLKCQEPLPAKSPPVKVTYITDPDSKKQVPLFNGVRYEDLPPDVRSKMNKSTAAFIVPFVLAIIIVTAIIGMNQEHTKQDNIKIIESNFYIWKARVHPKINEYVSNITLDIYEDYPGIDFVLNSKASDEWYTEMSEGQKKQLLDNTYNAVLPISPSIYIKVFAPDGTLLGSRDKYNISIDR